MAFLELLSRPAYLAPTMVILGFIVYQLFLKPSRFPKLPIVGAKDSDWFPLYQARWRALRHFERGLREAERKHKNEAVILPLIGSDAIMLPRSETQFVIDQPENVLSLHAQTVENVELEYTVTKPEIIHDSLLNTLITNNLTKQIGTLVPNVLEEIVWGLDKEWGNDNEYREVCVFESTRHVIGYATNRVFVGSSLCRNQEFLDTAMAYAQTVPLTATFLKLFSEPLRPLVAFFATIPIHRITCRMERLMLPEIQRRLAADEARQRDPEDHKHMDPEPNDFLQWTIRQAKEIGDPHLWSPVILTNRILVISFAAMHTTSFAITHVLLDLAASKQEYIDALRSEVESVLAEHGGKWNRRALSQMVKLDSTLRESQRLNMVACIGIGRKVVVKEGVITPSGVKLPYGANVFVPAYTVMHDEELYNDAESFKPFRFAEESREAFPMTSCKYLAFGHGRSACPGRFFAANELKLMLAYILLKYDTELTPGKRPENKWIGQNIIPPMEATIRIRKRAGKA
ncbi:cytochrome P450 [Sordaria brevicollis]|uniref:Cytochrome P450 n=1 Tax=Sordaria brevicollis TaxID=83679 RepID=A0AAE0PML4_SORBR|nr:cytochrome P450 [Sordaria brevicollis]